MTGLIIAIAILAGLGFIFGLILAICTVVFKVKEDERIEKIASMLPNYNCGSCGYAGCKQMAEAIVKGEEKKVSKCKPGKPDINFIKIKQYLDEHPNEDGTKINVEF